MTMGGYTGPPALTLTRAFSAWTVSVTALFFIVIAGGTYLWAVAAVRRSGRTWPVGRTLCFVGLGLGSFAVATMSFLGAYAHVLFWVYATQVVTLLMVTPALLALGAPMTLAEAVLAPPLATRLASWPETRHGRVLTYPVVGTLLIAAVPFVVYFTHTFEFLMRHRVAYELGQLIFVAIGFLFFWPLLSSDRHVRRWSWPVATLVVFVETLFDSVPGIAIWLSTRLIAPTYFAEVARPWGRSAISDQKFGGVMLWAVGEVVGVPLIIAMAVQWMRADEREAGVIDRELDNASNRIPESLETPDQEGGQIAEPTLDRPWWETDPERLRRSRKFDWE
ncbi:MAG: cytochrome c oxidase assembly protein [Actinomycetes bacterium]